MKRRRGKGIKYARDNQQEAMVGRTRRIHNDVLVDRISVLPDDIIDCIMNLLGLCDKVKTSALSISWRHRWTRASNLEFDMDFYWNIIYQNKLDFEKVVDSVLSQHHGPAEKFLIYVSSLFSRQKSLDVSQWLNLLSEKELKEFALLAYVPSRVSVSSELFKWPLLERVTLRRCEVICSNNLGSFSNLVYLNLDSVIISDESLELLITKFPLLETLYITFSEYGRPFVVNVPKLTTLSFCTMMCSRPLRLSCFPSLTVARLLSALVIPVNFPEELKLSRFVYQLPNIEKIVLNADALKSLAARNLPKQTSRTLDHLKHLELQKIDVSSLDQIKCAFCLIRSSPNLQSLEIQMAKPVFSAKHASADFLEGQIKEGKLSGIKTVKFVRYVGFSYELLLVKVILSCCPMLERVDF